MSKPLEKQLKEFVRLGQEIIGSDSGLRYAPQWAGRILQPGFMSPTRNRILVLNLNPSQGDRFTAARPIEVEAEREAYRIWGKDGTLEAYQGAYSQWLQRVQLWDTARKWVLPILEKLGVPRTEFAWLNIVKLPTKGASDVTERMVTSDLNWLDRQLNIVDAPAILVGGKGVYHHCKELLEDKYSGQYVVQDRVRSKPLQVRRLEMREHVRAIEELLYQQDESELKPINVSHQATSGEKIQKEGVMKQSFGQEQRSGDFIRIFDQLNVDYHLKDTVRIDNNKVLKSRGRSLKLYFNEATEDRPALFAANQGFYSDFEWSSWQDVKGYFPGSKTYFLKVPIAGKEQNALSELLDYVKSRE